MLNKKNMKMNINLIVKNLIGNNIFKTIVIKR